MMQVKSRYARFTSQQGIRMGAWELIDWQLKSSIISERIPMKKEPSSCSVEGSVIESAD